MSNLEVLHRQKGIGYLVLKSGFCTLVVVEWVTVTVAVEKSVVRCRTAKSIRPSCRSCSAA